MFSEDRQKKIHVYRQKKNSIWTFQPLYLSYFWVKIQSLCAHLTRKFPNFSKLTPLLSLDPFKGLLWAFYQEALFFGTPCT